MNKHSRKVIALAVILGIFLIFQLFFMPTQAAKTRLGSSLQGPRIFFKQLSIKGSLMGNIISLQNENQSLRAQILILKEGATLFEEENKEYLRVRTYSNYPFNNKNQILIATGLNQGIEDGDTALAQPGIFLGEIIETKDKNAKARTIFDFNWELPVKIGEEKIDGLLIGGHDPSVTLISKSKNIQVGDPITLASPDFPIGLTIGFVNEVIEDKEELFKEAKIRFPYNITEINYIYIPTN
jgi:cell shape-determining protein MreC